MAEQIGGTRIGGSDSTAGERHDTQAAQAVKRETGFSKAISNAGVSILWQDSDLKVRWARNVPAWWGASDLTGAEDADYIQSDDLPRLIAAKRHVLASGNPERLEMRIPSDEATHWFDVWVEADEGAEGEATGIVTTFVEATRERRREQTVTALLREVSHRSKNLLAIIQSIATQTGRYSSSVDEFLARFRGRLQSLASSQDLVTSSNWKGADLRELVTGQVGRYSSDPARNVRYEGENPYLNPNAALHIGLALHELAVNSMRYGALSVPDGFVTVSATRGGPGEARDGLSLSWTEKINPSNASLQRKRFGSLALERVVPASLSGAAHLAIEADRLDYRLTIPAGSFELD